MKYEDIFLRGYRSVPEPRAGLSRDFRFYNVQRRHQALAYRTPEEGY